MTSARFSDEKKTLQPTLPSITKPWWWGGMDSNHRSETQQIYSLPPLATREPPHMELVMGLEPATC